MKEYQRYEQFPLKSWMPKHYKKINGKEAKDATEKLVGSLSQEHLSSLLVERAENKGLINSTKISYELKRLIGVRMGAHSFNKLMCVAGVIEPIKGLGSGMYKFTEFGRKNLFGTEHPTGEFQQNIFWDIHAVVFFLKIFFKR